MGNGGDPSIAGMDPDRLTIGRPTGGGGGGGGDGQSGSDTGDDPLTGASGRPGGFPGSAGEAGGSKFGESLGGLAGSAPAQLEPPDFGSPQVGAEGGSNAGLQNGSPSPGSAGFSSGSDLPSSTGDDGQAGSSGGSAGSPATDGLPNFSAGVESDGRPNKPSRESAHRWGISSPRASIGFERDVTVYIEAQRIFVGGQPPIPCGRGETSQQLSRAFLRSLDRDARSWGRPPDSFYWVPNLKFEISPGGLVHHERLQNALQRHALTSSVDYRLELSRPAPMPSLVE